MFLFSEKGRLVQSRGGAERMSENPSRSSSALLMIVSGVPLMAITIFVLTFTGLLASSYLDPCAIVSAAMANAPNQYQALLLHNPKMSWPTEILPHFVINRLDWTYSDHSHWQYLAIIRQAFFA